jgi:phosphopantothenoylcysteine decarboxylase/phosphopantothenate--cysteine ligase
VELVPVRSAREMEIAVKERFPQADALLMAAAVSDYRPEQAEPKKMKRGQAEVQYHLVQNPDILKALRGLKTRQVLVGFAAETHDLEAEARRKMQEKGLDLIAANDVNQPDAGFQVDTNEVILIARDGAAERLPLLPKEEVADRILNRVAPLIAVRRGTLSA